MPEVPGTPNVAAASAERPASSALPAPAQPDSEEPAAGSELPWYVLAVVFGLISGAAEVAVGDLMLTGFLALFFCMVMGWLRPPRPWRWTLVVCACIPLSRLFAADVLHIYTERAQIYEAFAAFITGNAGSYAGSLGRRRTNDLWKMIKSERR